MRATSARPSAGSCRVPRPRPRRSTRRWRTTPSARSPALVYEAIWNEYCDWGLEFAKVRLADERSAPRTREATWWTLVEVLDTYLRLLHPVMPFVTEALWAALPHRATDPELLIVARWPGVGEARPRGRATRSRCSSTSSARSATPARRRSSRPPTGSRRWSYVPVELGPTFEALRPAIERLARARPLHRELTPEALEAAPRPGDLTVIVAGGEIEAAVRPRTTDADADALERDRLERDLAEAEGWLAAARARLANESFVSRAPAAVVEGARAREAELADQVDRLRERTRR